jgi:hypothetical protein
MGLRSSILVARWDSVGSTRRAMFRKLQPRSRELSSCTLLIIRSLRRPSEAQENGHSALLREAARDIHSGLRVSLERLFRGDVRALHSVDDSIPAPFWWRWLGGRVSIVNAESGAPIGGWCAQRGEMMGVRKFGDGDGRDAFGVTLPASSHRRQILGRGISWPKGGRSRCVSSVPQRGAKDALAQRSVGDLGCLDHLPAEGGRSNDDEAPRREWSVGSAGCVAAAASEQLEGRI